MEQTPMPLQGIKVVELGTFVAVPSTARMLCEYGADVVKVEGFDGDEWRRIGVGHYTPTDVGSNGFFTIQNNNKKLVALNLKSTEGMEAFLKLVSEADVFVSNVRLASLKKMGIDYESLKEKFPKLIYCHFTGFGYEGPDAPRPGFDVAAFWSRGGAMVDWVSKEDFPVRPSSAFGDMVTGSLILSGILMALLGRNTTGHGTLVTTSLYASSIWYNAHAIYSAQQPYGKPFPEDPMRPSHPFVHYYKCKDGEWIDVAGMGYDRNCKKFYDLVGLPQFAEDPTTNTERALIENDSKPRVIAEMNKVFLTKTRDEWAAIFEAADVVYEKMMHFTDVPNDPQAWANGYLEKVQMANGDTPAMSATPISFSEYGKKHYTPCGDLGQHTAEVLADLGYTEAQITKMKETKAVK